MSQTQTVELKLYSLKNIDEAIFPDNEDGRYAKSYLVSMIKNGVGTYIDNVDGEMNVLIVSGQYVFPIFKPTLKKSNAYVASLVSHYIYYCIEELKELKMPKIEKVLKGALQFLGAIFEYSKIDKCIYINNWLVSTNLYPDFPIQYVSEITEFIEKEFAGYAVAWNSINENTTEALYIELKKKKYLFLAARSIYVYDPTLKVKKRVRYAIKKDMKVKEMSPSTFRGATENDIGDIKRLYDELYIEKYSRYNPMFNENFIKLSIQNRLLEYYILEKNSQSNGVIGYFSRSKWMTTPILGYEINSTKEEALYRILSIKLVEEAMEKGLILHSSSGAAEFKRTRGAINYYEYRAISLKKVPWLRKLAFKGLSMIVNGIGVPLLKRKKL